MMWEMHTENFHHDLCLLFNVAVKIFLQDYFFLEEMLSHYHTETLKYTS